MANFVTYKISSSKEKKTFYRNLKNVQNYITHPSSTIVCGITGSGKTTVVHNIIDVGLRFKIWDQIIVLSPDNDSEYDDFLEKLEEKNDIPKIILTNLPKNLDLFMSKIEEIHEETEIVFHSEVQTLLIIDDFHSEGTKNEFIRQIFTKNRHYGISLVFCTQNFNDLPVTVKTNSHYYYFMKDCNPQILVNVENKCGIMNLRKTYEACMKQTQSKYPWLLLNRRNRVCFDNEKNKYDLSSESNEYNIDLVTDNMFKNNFDILQKRELRKTLLEKNDLTSDIIDQLIKSRRPKSYDEEIKKMVPERYWRFWSIKK